MAAEAPRQSVRSLRVCPSRLRAGIQLKRRPIEGLAENVIWIAGTKKRELGRTQGGCGVLTRSKLTVERVHKIRCSRSICHFPQRADDVVSACPHEGPGETDEPFAGIRALSRSVARRNGHQFRPQVPRDD